MSGGRRTVTGTAPAMTRGPDNPGSLSIEELFRRNRAAPDPALWRSSSAASSR